MLNHEVREQSYAPQRNNQEGDHSAYEATHAALYQCVNCGELYRPGELMCAHCGVMFSSMGHTQRLATGTVVQPPRTRRVGDLVKDDQKSIVFMIQFQRLVIPIAKTVIVGRIDESSSDNQTDIDLTHYNARELGISRQHLRLTRTRDMIRIADLGSLNGTYLNGLRLVPQQERLLRDGDELFIAQLRVNIKF